MKLANTIPPDNLLSAGTCFGKFTKTNKFRLHITALNYLAPYAQVYFKYLIWFVLKTLFLQNKIWLKASAEQQFLYGHHVTKSGLGRISENTEKYNGVLVYSMSDLPLGFGVAAKSTVECKFAEPLSTVCFHQADIGEYIRAEEELL